MRRLIFTISMAICLVIAAAQTSRAEDLARMWLQGNQDGVMAIAIARLEKDPRDLAGLLLSLEYQMDAMDVDGLKRTVALLEQVNLEKLTGNTAKQASSIYALLDSVRLTMRHLIPEIVETDKAKQGGKNKHLSIQPILNAIEMDGRL